MPYGPFDDLFTPSPTRIWTIAVRALKLSKQVYETGLVDPDTE